MSSAGVPCGGIRSVGEVCTAPQLVERGMILEAPHPVAGRMRSLVPRALRRRAAGGTSPGADARAAPGRGDARLAGLRRVTRRVDEAGARAAFERAIAGTRGTLHGGVLATALDIAMGHLINRHAGPGTTLEMKIQYLAPVRGGRVTCRGEALRRGGTWFLRAEARDETGTLVAYATSTWRLLKNAAPNVARHGETP